MHSKAGGTAYTTGRAVRISGSVQPFVGIEIDKREKH
jgi:hypothetical protein